MANKSEKNDLGYLGQEFQYKLIHTLMEDKDFFKDLHSIIDQNMFTDAYLKTYVGVMKDYYESKESVPSYPIMEIVLNEKAPNDTEREIYHETIKRLQSTPSDGVEYIRDLAEKFFRQQNIIKTANEILKIAGNGDTSKYERCVDLLNEALNKGAKEECGTTVMTNVNETLSDDYRTPIPTGIGKIDDTLEGGLGKGELGVIVGPTSFGKVQPFDSQIVTPNGFVNMGDIKVGDYVIGCNGKPTKVTGVFPHYDWEFYKVDFSDGASTECGKEHLWAVNTYNQHQAKDLSFKVMSLGEIMKRKLKVHLGRYNFKIPMCEPVYFNEIDVKISPYIIGLMIGNGSFIKKGFGCSLEDINSIEPIIISESKDFNYTIKTVLKNGRSDMKYVTYNDKKFIDNFINYYDLSLKSDNKFIHRDYLFNSIENRILLLNGLMDAYGTCKKNGYSCFRTKSKQLAEDVRTLVLSLGGRAIIREKKCGMKYEVTITLCEPSIPIFNLKRKQDNVVYKTLQKSKRYIDNIEYSRTCNGQCISVDAEDELYLCDDFIVTHNTSLTTAMASYAATYKCETNNFQGYKVLQIVFEDRIKQIQRKHIGRITGVEAKDLSKPENIANVREQLEKYEDKDLLQNNLRIVKFPSGEITPSYLIRYIKKLINAGFKPDMCIADYFECLANESTTANEYSDEGRTMRKLEAMAGELDLALWIPSQGTKDSINAELVTMDKMGGSVKKAQIAHVIMSIARTVEDIERNLATIAVLKNRAGQSGKVYNNVEFNNGTCRISTDNVDEFDSMVKFNENKTKEILALQNSVFKSTRK